LQPHREQYSAVRCRAASAACVAAATASAPVGFARNERRFCSVSYALRAAGLGAIAGLGLVGLDDAGPDADPAVITGYKAARNRSLARGQKLSNKALAAVRAPVEHGFAHLKNWRVLGQVRTDPRCATALVRALLVLTNREVAR
ncbi:transposase family protein, partial [Streptomyces sp. NPDC047081]|uniref:transposase family protein n=1 Tax=Streptomyces sp. NPDC047081 TaxID=3154706 RepID=UPI00341086B3